jgi:hypothetical protein
MASAPDLRQARCQESKRSGVSRAAARIAPIATRARLGALFRGPLFPVSVLFVRNTSPHTNLSEAKHALHRLSEATFAGSMLVSTAPRSLLVGDSRDRQGGYQRQVGNHSSETTLSGGVHSSDVPLKCGSGKGHESGATAAGGIALCISLTNRFDSGRDRFA